MNTQTTSTTNGHAAADVLAIIAGDVATQEQPTATKSALSAPSQPSTRRVTLLAWVRPGSCGSVGAIPRSSPATP